MQMSHSSDRGEESSNIKESRSIDSLKISLKCASDSPLIFEDNEETEEEKKNGLSCRNHREEMRAAIKKSFSLRNVLPSRFSLKIQVPRHLDLSFAERIKETQMEDFADLHFRFDKKYETLELLGEGGSSIVKKIKERSTGTVFAAKIIKSNDPEVLKAIKNEFELVNSLSHPGIIKVKELFFDPCRSCATLVQQFVPGITLSEYIQQHGPIPEAQAKSLFKEILAALSYLHSQGVCHRDIKTDNILIKDPIMSNSEEFDQKERIKIIWKKKYMYLEGLKIFFLSFLGS